MQKAQKLRRVLTAPSFVVLIVSLSLLLISLAAVEHVRPFTSDDVSWQNALLTWRPFDGHIVMLGGSDPFVVKVPFFIVLGHFIEPGRKLLALESGLFAVLTFTLFYIASLYFMKKLRIKLSYINLLPFVWLASFGSGLGGLFLNPILRNFEIGLSFITFMLAAKLYYGEVDPNKSFTSRLVTVLVGVVAGILTYNDPYFLYFTIVPIVVFYLVLFTLRRVDGRKLLTVLGLAVISLGCAKLTAHLTFAAGARTVFAEPIQFVDFDSLFRNLSLALHGTFIIFGADIFGRKPASLGAFAALVNVGLVAFLAYQIGKDLKVTTLRRLGKEDEEPNLWPRFLALLGAFVVIVYSFSTVAVDIETYRYLVMLVFSSVLFLALILPRLKVGRVAVITLLVTATTLNLATSLAAAKDPGGNRFYFGGVSVNTANSQNYEVIRAVEQAGITKGYTTYWAGNINSYLSKGKVTFLPILCVNGLTQPSHFLVDDSLFTRSSSKTFYMFDPDANDPPACSMDQVIKQFGQPQQVRHVADKTILFYDYDLEHKF